MKKIIFILAVLVLLFQPVQADIGRKFYGIEITRTSNYVTPKNTAFPFDAHKFGIESMWSDNKIVIPIDGIWVVGADITTLGTLYGGNDNSKVQLEIVKNWCGDEKLCPHLQADICWSRFEQDGCGANGNSFSCPVYLKRGDYLQLLILGNDDLLVESNPDNTGRLSPNFYAYWLGE